MHLDLSTKLAAFDSSGGFALWKITFYFWIKASNVVISLEKSLDLSHRVLNWNRRFMFNAYFWHGIQVKECS